MPETQRGSKQVIARSILLACVLLACCSAAFALNPSLDVSQYAHTSWKIRDGFPKGTIQAFAQTPDGYLWLGTEFGLFRFDGVRSVPWQQPPEQPLPSDSIHSLQVTQDGTLWIGTDKGLASWKDGRVTQYADLAGHYVFSLLEDRRGSLWVGAGAVPIGKLCEIERGRVHCAEEKNFAFGVFSLYEDSNGNLWAGVPNGVWRWRPGAPKFFPLGAATTVRSIVEMDGLLLLISTAGFWQLLNDKLEPYRPAWSVSSFVPIGSLRDRDGGFWIVTNNQGLIHFHQGRTDVFRQSDGLSSDQGGTLFEDREGNIWVSTINGLDRFRPFVVTTLFQNQGLPSAAPFSIQTSNDGSVWVNSGRSLSRWNQGQVTIYRERPEDQSSIPPNVREVTGFAYLLGSLFEDKRGRIWLSTREGVGYLENNKLVMLNGVPGGVVRTIVEDKQANLWINHQQSGLFRVAGGNGVQSFAWASLGRKDFATAVVVDPLKGGLWLGFWDGGVAYFEDGQVRASYSTANGLGQGRVKGFQVDTDGAVWAATQGGLSRLKDGRVATLTTGNGLPCNVVNWVIEDNNHSLWLSTSCGLIQIPRSELDAWTADSKRTIQSQLFDTSDGVRIIAESSGFSPQVAKSSDGKLWFVTADGVSVIDPNQLSLNKLPPPVHIEQITADHKTYDARDRLSLPPLVRDLQIDFTALSLVAPEKVMFRYKLESRDRNWQDAGNRRQAFYTNLPPGNYRFRVIACNNSGVWNETGTFLDFSIAPAYYQTIWFRVALVAVFLITLAMLYQLRLRQVARQVRGRMEERHEERERIARDLHDTLLQSVQGLIFKFHAVSRQIPPDAPAHDALEKTLDLADQVLAEGRDRIRNLRVNAESLSDLPAAFRRVAKETTQVGAPTFKTVVEGSGRELHPLVLHEAYCIGREALVNALTHSHGLHVEVEITYDSRQFRLRVRDDGRGIDSQILEEGGRADHWGLQGMRERAQRIGAQLNLWSRPQTGTEVELIVPGATAYQAEPGKSKFWFRRQSKVDGEQI